MPERLLRGPFDPWSDGPRRYRDDVDDRGAAGEQHLRDLFDSVDEGYCLAEMVLDDAGEAVDYRFLEVNARFEAMTGLADAVGRTARELVPGLEDVWVRTYARVALDGVTTRFEQGSAVMGRWFDVHAVPARPRGRFALVFRDETARRQAEEALRRSEALARATADDLRERTAFLTELTSLLPGLLRVEDVEQGRTVLVGGRTESVVGRPAEDLLADLEASGGDLLSAVHPDDVAAYRAHTRSLADLADGQTATLEFRVRHADGSWRWLSARDVVLDRGDDGRVRRVLGFATDVTDAKAAEAALLRTASVQAFRARLGDAIRGLTDPVAIQAGAARALGEHLGADRVHYAEVDAAAGAVVVAVDWAQGLDGVAGRHPLGPDTLDLLARLRDEGPLVVEDVATDTRLPADLDGHPLLRGVRSVVLWPLVKEAATVAVLAVHGAAPRAWSDDDVAAVDDTAERTWSAVHRARAEAALARRSARAELVADLLATLESQPTLQAQLQRLAELLVPSFADFATVELPDGETTLLGLAHRDPALVETLRELRRDHRLRPDDPNSVAQAARGRPQLISDLTPQLQDALAPDERSRVLLRRLANRSHMAVPLRLGHGEDGVLVVGLSDPARPLFDEQALAFLTEAAQRAGIVLAAARLRRDEHDVAVRLQRALLPDRLVWHPDVLLDARYEAANDLLEVGGDWYDSFSWPDGHVGLVVGDVVGHTLDSAATMGRLRAATAALATTLPPSPAALLEALEQFARGPDGTDYATAVCVVLDPATGDLTWSSAGHPPPVVAEPGRPPRRLTGAQAPPVCAVAAGPRPEATVRLAPGALVVLYSDGLVERRREPIDVGIGRLEEAAGRCAAVGSGAQEAARSIVDQVAGAGTVEDDVVVACLHWTPARARFEHRLAGPRDLAASRRALRAWLAEQDVDRASAEDVLLCLGEACSNAVEHAYAGGPPGPVDVEVTHHGGHLTGRVRDHGAWRPGARQDPFRGRGTAIMTGLAVRFDRTTGPDGTSVVAVLPVRPSVTADLQREEVAG